MDFVVYDTEYTTWEGAMARKWLGENEYKEVIQIGALKVSFPDFEVKDSLKIYIKPQKNPVLSDYCKRLTGITQAEIDNGVAAIRKYFVFPFCYYVVIIIFHFA